MSSPIAIPVPIPHGSPVLPTSSPTFTDRFAIHRRDDGYGIRQPKVLRPVDNEGLRFLLLENISQEAVEAFKAQGFHVDHSTKAMSEQELLEKISSYHAIGIRSKTKLTEKVIRAASKV